MASYGLNHLFGHRTELKGGETTAVVYKFELN